MKRPKPQVRTKERYILDSLEKIFPGGGWVTSSPENYEQPLYLTVIGGTKYDRSELTRHIPSPDFSTRFVVGGGRGVESDLAKWCEHEVLVLEPDPDRYGKNARKINVEQVLSFAPESPLLLVGSGERVKQARAWLKRANWPREVTELP